MHKKIILILNQYNILEGKSMNKKILAILAILIVAASAVTFVSAADTVKVNDVEFNVPDGYKYDKNITESYADQNGFEPGTLGIFSDSTGKNLILISVHDVESDVTVDDINTHGYSHKIIAGKDGIYTLDGKNNQFFMFEYIQDGKKIVVEANTEELVEETIK